MERITITIETGNAAFEDEPATEIARILRGIADRFEWSAYESAGSEPLRDINGNACGSVKIEGDKGREAPKGWDKVEAGDEGDELDASEARGLARMAGDMDA